MYNTIYKNEFLKKYLEDTSYIYKSYFERIENFEEAQDKDVAEFSLEEIEDLFRELRVSYFSVLKSYASITRKYIDFMIDSRYVFIKSNPLDEINNSILRTWLVMDSKLFFSATEIIEIAEGLNNYQDSVIPVLVFEGVQGDGASELYNLKVGDADLYGCCLTLTNSKGDKRSIDISYRSAEVIGLAVKELSYTKANGKMSGASNVRDEAVIIQTDYVIRPTDTTSNKSNKPVDKFLIYKRLSRIAKELGYKNFNIKNISRSGMLKMAWDSFYNRFGNVRIPDEELLAIANRYGVKSINSLREFVTFDMASINDEE